MLTTFFPTAQEKNVHLTVLVIVHCVRVLLFIFYKKNTEKVCNEGKKSEMAMA